MDAILLIALLAAWIVILVIRGRLAEQQAAIDQLMRRLRALEGQREVSWAPPPAPAAAPVAPSEPPPVPPSVIIPAPQPAGETKVRPAIDWEAWVGGNILNKLGALLLVIGVMTFLGYYGTRMTPAGRAGCATLAGLILLGSGVWLERREAYRMFARGLMGAGWAALYATAYAIYAVPATRLIESPFLGSVLVMLVAAGMIAHSLRYRSEGVTAVAFFSAFAALAITPSTLFGVLALIPLAAAVLYLAQRFDWYGMALMGVLATYGACAAHGQSNAPLVQSEALFILYWALFEIFDLMRFARRVGGWAVELIFPLNAAGFLSLSYASWTAKSPDTVWMLSGCAALLYALSTIWRVKIEVDRGFESSGGLAGRIRSGSYEAPLSVGAILLAAAIIQKLTGMWEATLLAMEAEALFAGGVRLQSRWLKGLAVCGFVVSLFNVAGISSYAHSWVWLLLFHAVLFYANRAMSPASSSFGRIFSWAASLMLMIVAGQEIERRWIGLAWFLLAAVLLELGIWKRLGEFRWQAYAIGASAWIQSVVYVQMIEGGSRFPFVKHPGHAVLISYAVAALASWYLSGRLTAVSDKSVARGIFCGAGLIAGFCFVWFVVPDTFVPAMWAGIAYGILTVGDLFEVPEYGWQAQAGSGAAALSAFFFTLPDGHPMRIFGVVLLIAAHIAFRIRSRANLAPYHVGAAAVLTAALIYQEVSGSMLTIAWGAEALVLLAAGFALRDRWPRLDGLALFLICVLKLFLYDLRNLAMPFRILSFLALGLILLGVSWIYTRYREQLQKLL